MSDEVLVEWNYPNGLAIEFVSIENGKVKFEYWTGKHRGFVSVTPFENIDRICVEHPDIGENINEGLVHFRKPIRKIRIVRFVIPTIDKEYIELEFVL